MFFNFIWNGKSDRIKRNTLIGDISQGGLKMIHLQSESAYLKVSWTKRLVENLDGYWQKILLFYLKNYGGIRIFSFQKEKIKEVALQVQSFLERCFIKHLQL